MFIDVGMGLYRVNDSIAGIIRTTTCCSKHHRHAEACIDLAGDEAPGEYERNAQLAELNALNAALAVIKWKKARGFYNDLTRELNSEYVIDGNKLINSYCLDANPHEVTQSHAGIRGRDPAGVRPRQALCLLSIPCSQAPVCVWLRC